MHYSVLCKEIISIYYILVDSKQNINWFKTGATSCKDENTVAAMVVPITKGTIVSLKQMTIHKIVG